MHSISRAKRTCSTHGLALAVVALAMAGPVAAVVVRDDLSMESTAERAKPYANSIAWLHLLDDAGLILAEGTVLSPEWVLTAAHAVDGPVVSGAAYIAGRPHDIALRCTHPDWNGTFEDLHDIALLKLGTPSREAVPARIEPQAIEPGTPVLLLGRGFSGDGKTGPVTDDRELRAATNLISEVGPLHLAFTFDPPGAALTTSLEGVSGPGDSGGPLFLDQPGVPVLVGVSSAQDDAPTHGKPGTYGVIEYYSRVSAYVDWINSVRADPVSMGCTVLMPRAPPADNP